MLESEREREEERERERERVFPVKYDEMPKETDNMNHLP
jgi:hypothetical protein